MFRNVFTCALLLIAMSNLKMIAFENKKLNGDNVYSPVTGNSGNIYMFSPTGIQTYYYLQSNGVANQIWQDPLIPNNVHATFMYSEDITFVNRYSAYLFSNDGGATWQNCSPVPSSRSGFPSISLINGSAIIANHSSVQPAMKIQIDAGVGFCVFTQPDLTNLPPISMWPKVLGVSNQIILAAVPGYIMQINGLNVNWSQYDGGSGAESYSISKAPNGNIGHAYLGNYDGVNDNDAFYRNSTDDGLTWSQPVRIWDWSLTDSLGVLRGISMVFGNNNEPYVAFEVSKLTHDGFFPELPSSIRVWSPNMNGGVPKIIADENNVPFYPNLGNVSDGFLPLCRPSIGRSSMSGGIYVAFNATTGQYGADSSSYYSAWLVGSFNYGNNWFTPDRFTPTIPLKDWRYVNMSQVNNATRSELILKMICQADSVAGSFVNGSPEGLAEAITIRAIINTSSINTISNAIPNNFKLHQNYPNPFNPSTSIRFDVQKQSNVTLKIFDSNGKEIETLINNEVVTPGTKEIIFGGRHLSSGIYFYAITAGDFRGTKKMILVK